MNDDHVIAGRFVATFKEFPPRQKPSSFSVDQVMQQLEEGRAVSAGGQ